jgi:hypothetical protein
MSFEAKLDEDRRWRHVKYESEDILALIPSRYLLQALP